MHMNPITAFLSVATVAACCLCHADGDAIVLENPALRISFADAAHGFAIGPVENRLAGGVRFAEPQGDGSRFWRATFRKPGDTKTSVTLDGRTTCRAKRIERHADGGATFVWEGLDLPGEPAAVTVRARVAFTADLASEWTLDVQNQSAAWGLAETEYPLIANAAKDGEADFLCPRQDLGAKLVRKRPYGGRPLSFACMSYMPMMTAFMIRDAGLYFAAHDSSARIKRLRVMPDNGLRFQTDVENAGIPGKAAEGPRYAVTLAAFRGDWWQAARLYRKWALTTKWTAKGRILDRADYPRRICEIPLWLNIHAHPEEVSNVMARVRTLFPSVDGGIHWHLWQHSPHDVNYPEYLPEQKGTRECVAFCKSIGEEALPYTNGRLWSQTLLSFPYARPYAITQADGSPVTEKYGPVTPPLSPMCPATAMWNDSVNDFAGRILDLGFGSIFLDQIGACGGKPCFACNHGHNPGGGTWYFEGYQQLLSRLHRTYSGKGAFLTTEGSGEAWMNVIDGYLTVTQRTPEDVPFLHAVYNGYTTWFCTPENHEDDDDSFWAAQARELVWGQSLGWYHPLILDKPSKCELLRRLTAFRQANLDCFAYGELVGEIAFDKTPDQPVTWLGRKPFWAWRMPDYPLSPTLKGVLPGVVGYEWKNGVTGKPCLVFANLTSKPQTVAYTHNGVRATLALAPRELLCK